MAETQRVTLVHITTIANTQYLFLRGQNAYMQERGFVVHAIATPSARLLDLARRDGVITHGIPISRTVQPLADLVSLWRLWRCLCVVRPAIVVVGTPKAALLGSLASWLARVPVRIFMFHGSITESAVGARGTLYRTVERLTASLCHQVICVSPSLLRFARQQQILSGTKGTVLVNGTCNGIDSTHFDPRRDDVKARARQLREQLGLPPEAQVVGYVGRLCGDKGIDDLAPAWRTLCGSDSGTRLLLVGGWEPEDPVCYETRQELEGDPRVCFTGSVADVRPYYALMDVVVLPTRGTEGFPTVPMEAAAMGVPVVATSVVGCVDAVVDGVTGTLVPPRDPAALAIAIRQYLDDDELRRRHGTAGRERVVRDFAPEPIWHALYGEYCRLLREKGLPEPRPLGDLPQGEAMVGVQKGDPA